MKKLLCLVLVLVLSQGLVGCGNGDEGGTKDQETVGKDTTPDQETVGKDTTPTFGTVIKFDNLEITFGEAVQFTAVKNKYSDLNGKDVIKIPVTVKNVGSEIGGLNMFFVNVYGSKGVTLDDPSAYFDDDIRWVCGTDALRPDAEMSAYIYLLYDGDGDYYVAFDNWSEKIEVKLPISK